MSRIYGMVRNLSGRCNTVRSEVEKRGGGEELIKRRYRRK
jgi:hypothetical protein